jgi:hypothetical protein
MFAAMAGNILSDITPGAQNFARDCASRFFGDGKRVSWPVGRLSCDSKRIYVLRALLRASFDMPTLRAY